jgi:hypothetical protein
MFGGIHKKFAFVTEDENSAKINNIRFLRG